MTLHGAGWRIPSRKTARDPKEQAKSMQLQDPSLHNRSPMSMALRARGSRRRVSGDQPGDWARSGKPCQTWERPKRPARSKRPSAPFPPGARCSREGARRDPEALVRSDDGAPDDPRPDHDRRAGKPLAEARAKSPKAPASSNGSPEEGKRIYGDVIPATQGGRRIVILKQPVGVVGAITPWNFPNAMITRKQAPRLPRMSHRHQVPPPKPRFRRWRWPSSPPIAPASPKGVINVVTSKRASVLGEVLTTHRGGAQIPRSPARPASASS